MIIFLNGISVQKKKKFLLRPKLFKFASSLAIQCQRRNFESTLVVMSNNILYLIEDSVTLNYHKY